MEKVTTELDGRFSDPGAEPTPWAQTEQTLREAQLFWISTVRRDGRPHVTPLVAVWAWRRTAFLHRSGRAEGTQPRSQPEGGPEHRL